MEKPEADADMGLAGAFREPAMRGQARQQMLETPPRKVARVPPMTPPATEGSRRGQGAEANAVRDPYLNSPGRNTLMPSPMARTTRSRSQATRTPIKAQGRKPVSAPSQATSLASKLEATRAAMLEAANAEVDDMDDEDFLIGNLRSASGPPPPVEID